MQKCIDYRTTLIYQKHRNTFYGFGQKYLTLMLVVFDPGGGTAITVTPPVPQPSPTPLREARGVILVNGGSALVSLLSTRFTERE